MNIIKSIETAMRKKKERGYDYLYWCIDVHGVILESTYDLNNSGAKTFKHALNTLRLISGDPSNKIILWTSSYDKPVADVVKYLTGNKIRIDYVNENPEYLKNEICDFTKKFYFDILLDDKAGFEPELDWLAIANYVANVYEIRTGLKCTWCTRCQLHHISDGKTFEQMLDESMTKCANELTKEIDKMIVDKLVASVTRK